MPAKGLVSARLKRLKSILRKIRRGQSGSVSGMDDIIGFRVICESLDESVELGARLEEKLTVRMKNYLETEHGAGLGYRAIHAIAKFDQPFGDKTVSVRFETQARSWYQHRWACWCESLGERAKEGFSQVDPDDRRTLDLISDLRRRSRDIEEWENNNPAVVQQRLPEMADPFNVGLAWFDTFSYGFEAFGQDVPLAVEQLNYLEAQTEVEVLLLVGITKPGNLKSLLRNTHPRFMRGGTVEPEYWMPETPQVGDAR